MLHRVLSVLHTSIHLILIIGISCHLQKNVLKFKLGIFKNCELTEQHHPINLRSSKEKENLRGRLFTFQMKTYCEDDALAIQKATHLGE